MIKDNGHYFFSKRFFQEAYAAKSSGIMNPSALVLYILSHKASKLGQDINFFCTEDTLIYLKSEWEKAETIPAINKLLVAVSSSPNYSSQGEIILDAVSDISLHNSPNFTCLMVHNSEFEQLTILKDEMAFIGFKIFTPEASLQKEKLYPLGSDFMGRLTDLTSK